MTNCSACGHELGTSRFCTQCGRPAARPETALSSPAPRSAQASSRGPRTPPPAPSRRPSRFPLYADQPPGPSTPPPSAGLAETAVRPLHRPEVVPAPEPGRPVGLRARAAKMVADGDPTWLMSFGVLVGVLIAVFVLGCILVLI